MNPSLSPLFQMVIYDRNVDIIRKDGCHLMHPVNQSVPDAKTSDTSRSDAHIHILPKSFNSLVMYTSSHNKRLHKGSSVMMVMMVEHIHSHIVTFYTLITSDPTGRPYVSVATTNTRSTVEAPLSEH